MRNTKRRLADRVLTTVVIPALKIIDLDSLTARQLVLGTGAQESLLMHRKQIKGPARGLFQMEPATFNDLWNNYVVKRAALYASLKTILGDSKPIAESMVTNDVFAAAMCRVHYRRIQSPLPDFNDINGHANYWKMYYNTKLGKGRVNDYMRRWNEYTDNDTPWGE